MQHSYNSGRSYVDWRNSVLTTTNQLQETVATLRIRPIHELNNHLSRRSAILQKSNDTSTSESDHEAVG